MIGGLTKRRGKIFSFQTVTLHLGGMRGVCEYEITSKDGKAVVSRYDMHYNDGEKDRVLEERAECGEERMLKLMNDCKLLSWDGFYGKHPKGVLDGTTFRLEATVNGDRHVSAHGSQNFPRRYHDFTDGLYAILDGRPETE